MFIRANTYFGIMKVILQNNSYHLGKVDGGLYENDHIYSYRDQGYKP